MSALAGEPDHFADWAAGEGWSGPTIIVPRRDYRRYLAALLDGAGGRGAGDAARRSRVEDATAVRLASGERDRAATRRCSPAAISRRGCPARLRARTAIHDPWGADGSAALAAAAAGGGELLLVGTGLTMVDMAVSLEEAGFAGRITRALAARAGASAARLAGGGAARLGAAGAARRAGPGGAGARAPGGPRSTG